jgi:exo-beta-1,3-glucanase (GH17 family)
MAMIVIPGCGRIARGPRETADPGHASAFLRQEPFEKRALPMTLGDRWIGNGVAYGPHRDGQYPGGPSPSRDELGEDLRLMSSHWSLLRLYGAVGPAETILQLIREDQLDMKIMLGVWIEPEAAIGDSGTAAVESSAARTANRLEIETAIQLAREYPDIVIALCVGNETQVSWSSHRVPPDLLIDYVREARARTSVPVSTADDFNFWNKPASDAVAREIDFIVTHAHPLWNGIQLENALEWTRSTVAEIQAAHPGEAVVLGETGWATRRHTEGEQATLMKGALGEAEQAQFYAAARQWIDEERVPMFFFEAFDENWKGGDHPDEVEKHWGLYRADRTPKMALVRER